MVTEDGKLFYCSLKFSTNIIHYKFPDWREMAWTSSRFYSLSLWFPGTHSHHFRSKTCQCIFSLLFTICSLAKKSIVTIIFKLKIQRTQHPEMFVYSEKLIPACGSNIAPLKCFLQTVTIRTGISWGFLRRTTIFGWFNTILSNIL